MACSLAVRWCFSLLLFKGSRHFHMVWTPASTITWFFSPDVWIIWGFALWLSASEIIPSMYWHQCLSWGAHEGQQPPFFFILLSPLCTNSIFFPSGWMSPLRFVPISPYQEEEILPKIVLVATCVLHLQDSELVLPLQLLWAILKKGSGPSLRVRECREWRTGDKKSGMGWWGLTQKQFFSFLFFPPTQKKANPSTPAHAVLWDPAQRTSLAKLHKGSMKIYGIIEPLNNLAWLIRDLKDHLIPSSYLFHPYL